MDAYKCFMDRQTLPEAAMARLLTLEKPRHSSTNWQRPLALAASLVVVMAAAVFGLWRGVGVAPGPQPPALVVLPSPSAEPTHQTDASDVSYVGWRSDFIAHGPGEDAKMAFPDIHGVDYADVADQPQLAASIATPQGSFTVELGKEDIQKLFWGPEGKPEVEHPKMDPGDFPLMLMNWAGYRITGRVIYDGNGDLWELTVQGEKGEDSFTLRAAPGHIPPTCVVQDGAVTTTVIDTQVKGWYRSYDRDGDDEVEHVCTSEFIAHGVGIRFENVGAGGMRAGADEATDLGGAMLFNQMFVTQMCHYDGGLFLDHIAHTDKVPRWRYVELVSLEQARKETDFAPYLPKTAPVAGEFFGRLAYQEGDHNQLFVRWSRGYDDVNVEVWLPEGERSTEEFVPVDVSVPASYDWRLYDGPICDSVPEEYQMDFFKPTFRAEDMSLEVIEARGNAKDTGGVAYRFYVLHENGVVVGYDCSKLTAQEVWAMVEPTL